MNERQIGPSRWLGRLPYGLLLAKPVLLLVGVLTGNHALAIAGVALILPAIAVALLAERRAEGTWQETHFDFIVRSAGVWVALAFNIPIFGTMLVGEPVAIGVLCGLAELAVDAALVLAWWRYERGEMVPEWLFHRCGVRSNWSARQPRKASIACHMPPAASVAGAPARGRSAA